MARVVEASQAESPLIVLVGPTASGKTALALRLAEELRGEIVSCDSVAVYQHLNIGSAKPTPEERARVPHHCLDLYAPDEHPTAGDYARHAREAMRGITARGRLPIIAGGTGLYLRATLDGLAPIPTRNEPLREKLRARVAVRGSGFLHRLLRRVDAKAAALIHPNDTPKLIRALEVTLTAQQPQSEQWLAGRDPLTGFRVLKFGLNPERARLYERINERAAAMFDRGLLAEAEFVRAQYGETARAFTTLGYAQALAMLKHELTLEDAVAQAQQGHRHYAKRQLTWFRADKQIHWLAGCGDDAAIQVEALQLVRGFAAGT